MNSYMFEPDSVLLQALIDYNTADPVSSEWSRSLDSMLYEWGYHNTWYKWDIQPELQCMLIRIMQMRVKARFKRRGKEYGGNTDGKKR